MLIVEILENAEKCMEGKSSSPLQLWSRVHIFPARFSSLPCGFLEPVLSDDSIMLFGWGLLSSLSFCSLGAAPPSGAQATTFKQAGHRAWHSGRRPQVLWLPAPFPCPSGSRVGAGQTDCQYDPMAESRLTQGIGDMGRVAGNTVSHGAQALGMERSTAGPSPCGMGPGGGRSGTPQPGKW